MTSESEKMEVAEILRDCADQVLALPAKPFQIQVDAIIKDIFTAQRKLADMSE